MKKLVVLLMLIPSMAFAQDPIDDIRRDSEGNYVFPPDAFIILWNNYKFYKAENVSKDKQIERLKKDRVAIEGLILQREKRILELENKLDNDYYTKTEVVAYTAVAAVLAGVVVYVFSTVNE